MSVSEDVIVVGGGPVGASCALELARAGASVTLLERQPEICPPESGAHANCGLLVPGDVTPLAAPGALGRGLRWMLDGSSPFYIAPRPSLALARWLWVFRAAASEERAQAAAPVLRALHVLSARLHDELAADGRGDAWRFHHGGQLQVFETPLGLAAAGEAVAWSRALGARVEELTADEARRLFPSLRCNLAGAFLFPDDGHLDPMLFTRAVARMAQEAGATAVTGAEALTLEASPRGVRVLTTRGWFGAGQAVLAAGAWTPFLTRDLGVRLPIEPAKGYSVDVDRPGDFPEMPLYLGDAHVVLTPLGDALRLGGTLELAGWDLRVRPRRVASLRAAGERTIGVPADAPVRRLWRGPRPVTPDGLPVIGRVPGRDRVILATGHCMLGLSLAPATGRLVAQTASGARPEIDLAPLALQRFSEGRRRGAGGRSGVRHFTSTNTGLL
jgi:D-amino-acid dehydrogenase